ncbi:MAG: hypothetical protein ACYC27_13220 [Armatimonadota bacterium]
MCFSIISGASAKYTPRIGTETGKDGTAYLIVNGRKAIDFMVNNGSLSPAQRAKIAADRLTAQVAKGLDLDYISFKQSIDTTKVLIDDEVLVIASKADAKAHKVSSVELASAWIRGLRDALSVPPLSASPTSMLIPLGETRTLSIQSLETSPVEAEIADPAIISADPNPKPGSLVISGKAIGNTTVTLKCGEHMVPIQISVKKYAAYASTQVMKGTVTGWNAPASLVARAARDAARRSITLEPGAEMRNISIVNPIKDLEPGKSVQTPVRIEITGGDYIPAQLSVPVIINNQVLPAKQASWIMYSNEPEQIKKYQTLFTGKMDALQDGMRLLYHHQNMMGQEVGFVIEVLNPSASPASIHIIEGISNPMIDTVIVGYKAGMEFMENHRSQVGRVIELPAGSRWAVVSQPLAAINTASGIMEFRQLSGEPLFIRVTAKPEQLRASDDPPGITLPASGLTASMLEISDHVYPQPMKTLDATFTAGKPWVFLRIGKNAIKHATQEKLLYGNYGVTYQINAKLENPTPQAINVELVYEATAGPVSGIFFIDGKLEFIKLLNPPKEKTITKVTIPAGVTKTLNIRTMPLSGSAYPATLIIRPAGTIASLSEY